MKILLNVTTSDIIAIVSAAIAFISIVLTFIGMRRNRKDNETKLVDELIDTIRKDPTMSETESKFEYGEHWYDDNFHNHPIEQQIDAYLAAMDRICHLMREHLIGKRTAKIFKYDLDRAATNPDCLCYLWNLYHFSLSQKKERPFSYLVRYAKDLMDEKTLKAFESEKESEKFEKRLRF